AFKLQNVICKSLDTSYAEFTRCEMKVVRRGVAAFFMHCKVYKLPVTNADVSVSLLKKSNGYRPFLFNQTLDYCYYMRNPQAYPLIYSMHKAFMPYSNINHSCPYEHDLIMSNLIYKEDDLKDLPLPTGDYMIRIGVRTQKILRGFFKIFISKIN
ncbi:hypothetical protein KR009_009569, partial [Drosophila setifemur]